MVDNSQPNPPRSRYQFLPDNTMPGAISVYGHRQYNLGTLVPVPGHPGMLRIFVGHGFIESIGCCQDQLVGARLMAWHRRTVLRLNFFQSAGRAGLLHESIESPRRRKGGRP